MLLAINEKSQKTGFFKIIILKLLRSQRWVSQVNSNFFSCDFLSIDEEKKEKERQSPTAVERFEREEESGLGRQSIRSLL